MPPYFCDLCGCPIYVGETAYELDDKVYCSECVEDGIFEVDYC